MRFKYLIAALICTNVYSLNTSFAVAKDSVDLMREKNRVLYDQVYPLYMESCSMTQVKRHNFEAGGTPGHAVIYIKGLCRDLGHENPRVKVCEPGRYSPRDEEMGIGFNDLRNPEAGLGFSANKEFRNMNWVAIPGKSLFFFGNLPQDQKLDRSYMDQLANKMLDLRTHEGMQIHDEFDTRKDKKNESLQKLVIDRSMDTDYAINFGRNLHCVRVPIEHSQLYKIRDYLNGQNQMYANNSKDYHWNGPMDNCTHFVHNVAAAAGFWDPRATGYGKLDLAETLFKTIFQIATLRDTDLALPAVRMLKMAMWGNDRDINNVTQLYSMTRPKVAVSRDFWLPTRHGVLVDIIDGHPQELNEMYDLAPRDGIMTGIDTQNPLRNVKKEGTRIARSPEYVDIRANLLKFRDKYSKFNPNGDLKALVDKNYAAFSATYSSIIDQYKIDVEQKLRLLDQIE